MQSLPLENIRFKEWLDSQNRSASSIASNLGLSRAVLSHILSGRNKLSLSVVQSAARTYQDFDLVYVVLGERQRKRPNNESIVTHYPAFDMKVNSTLINAANHFDQVVLVRNGRFRVLLSEIA
ncbi:MAG: helix-turn-helix transcriptional regulator [Cryomorphaceae bacterium]|nr:helix-turn-helix transcriptional regulator [Cryomorphaceae bacterium]